MYKKSYFWPLVALCVVSLFLFLGQTFFNTRGEPREAVVALSMLQQGNWVLPVNNGVELAFKPPFFHWCIAAISTVAGAVNEYTSRMPSALALSAMVLVGYVFYAKRRGAEVAFIAALLTLTNFEVHRAGVACRVDMVLTAMMVIALYQLYKWGEKDLKGVPWVAVLCLSAAALTKGPVGIVLPCLVPAVFLWIRGRKFLRIFFSFLMVAVLACVLPAVWYWAAYQQGGDHFLDLVLEENVYRFLGKMTYASHENPAWYNVMTVLAGYAPYTLLGLVSLFFLRYRKPQGRVRTWWSRFVAYIRNMDDARLYSLLCIVIIFTFYCIPKSKRSVYLLLPIYCLFPGRIYHLSAPSSFECLTRFRQYHGLIGRVVAVGFRSGPYGMGTRLPVCRTACGREHSLYARIGGLSLDGICRPRCTGSRGGGLLVFPCPAA